ncbi:MAG: YaiI/YqxD family protein [Aeromonas sp.]
MPIWVDADACPVAVKEILYRAAHRAQQLTTLVANQPLRVPPSPYIKTQQVGAGFDVADHAIAQQVVPGDLVITADIPLASWVIEAGGEALNPRGEIYTQANIAARLSMRNFMEELRGAGVHTGGPAPFNASDKQRFANALDRWLCKGQLS